MDISIRRGKIKLIMIICTMLLLDATVATLETIRFGLTRLPPVVIRVIMTSIYMYFIYKGIRWVKNLYALQLIVAIIIVALKSPDMTILLHPLMLSMLAVYSVAAFLLIFSKDIRCFLKEKITENKSKADDL